MSALIWAEPPVKKASKRPDAPKQRPYRIFSLIELLNIDKRDDEDGGAMADAMRWMRANPGRWFLVGELERDRDTRNREYVGLMEPTARKSGLEAEVLNNKVYARIPAAGGLPLSSLVAKAKVVRFEPLPMLQRDKFNWTLQELREAASTAREWLAGGVGYAAAA